MGYRSAALLLVILFVTGCQPELTRFAQPVRMVTTAETGLYNRPRLIGRIKYIPEGDTLHAFGRAGDFFYTTDGIDSGYVDRYDVVDPAALVALRAPLDFMVSKSLSDEAWGRANIFLSRYCAMKLQIATDYVLDTYNPRNAGFSYTIVRAPKANGAEITIQCRPPVDFRSEAAERAATQNAHAAAYYIANDQIFETLITQ